LQTTLEKEPEMMREISALTSSMKRSLALFLITGLVLSSGCGKKEGQKTIVKKGDKVKVEYTGTLEDGTVFDSSREGEPLEFVVGSGQLLPGFDEALEGMKLNEVKRVIIKAQDAYGERDESLVLKYPRDFLPEYAKPEKGGVMTVQDKDGSPVPMTIIDVTEDSVTVDFNHPLAGDLTLDIKVVGIE
jgi:peptidylprolyl isomerase